MKPQFSTLLIYALMGLLTFGYVCTARLGLSMFNILYDPKQMGGLSEFSSFTASSAMIDIWQYLAWSSLVGCLIWGIIRSRRDQFPEPHITPCVVHMAFIISVFFLNTVGALSPFIMPAYTIQ